MRDGPDISQLATLIGDPGRAHMLTALLDGRALSAGELARVAGVTLPTASGHLSRMLDGGLLSVAKQGRHRYFRLAGPEVADALSALLALAESRGHGRVRTGPKDAAMRKARSCYNHLAGELGVRAYDSLRQRGYVEISPHGLGLSSAGRVELERIGIVLPIRRNHVCRECLDWSERRMHLSGPLGTAILNFVLDQGWARRDADSRAIQFGRAGLMQFLAAFPIREDEVVDVGE